jgi:glycosyltransferase involved in cell wall biosynthesis
MRILVAHNRYQQPGGEDQCVVAEMDLLRMHGHEVITFEMDNAAITSMSRLELATRTVWNQHAYHNLRDLMKTHRPQIAHFHNTFPLISPAAYYAARAEHVAVVQTLHNFRLVCVNALLFRNGTTCEACLGKAVPWRGIVHKCYRDNRAASAVTATTLTLHRALGTWKNAVDMYIALSAYSRLKLVEGGLPEGKIATKGNFVSPDPGRGRGSANSAVFVGRLSVEKGLETLLEAWRHLEGSVRLKIVGDGPLAPLVREAAARDPSIEWLGNQPLEAVYELIGEAGCLILPSLCYENFPRVVIEAFSKGTPVIVSKLGAMAEIVDDGHTGLHVIPADAADLAMKVREMLAEPRRQALMRLAARQVFEQRFSAVANYNVLMSIYERALACRVQARDPIGCDTSIAASPGREGRENRASG